MQAYIIKILVICSVCFTTGCATLSENNDPFEVYNRAMFKFNDTFDRYMLKPVAQTYQDLTPELAKQGVSNFFSNLNDVTVAVSDLFQWKLKNLSVDISRLTLNTTLGLGGLFDAADAFNLKKNHEDFGQTLGYWGLGPGPYLVLPIIGPSNLRDAAALSVDFATDITQYATILENEKYVLLQTTKYVNIRANLIHISDMIDDASLDPYDFMRDSYLQLRQNEVYDGDPPVVEIEFDEDEDEDYLNQ